MNSFRRNLSTSLIAAAAAWLLLFGAIQWGLRTPRREVLGVSSQAPTLDYSAFSGFFTPLSAEYIAKILGLDLGGRSLLAGRPGTPRAGSLGSGQAAPLDITHPFTNDHFADAYVIPSIPFTARTDASGATREPGEPIDCSPTGGSVWYRYRPANDIGLIANTIGTAYTTALGVFTGDRLGNLEGHRCDLDPRGNALITFSAKAGIDYYFQISGPAGMGPLVFNLSPLGLTTLISRDPANEVDFSQTPSMTPDGRYLAFYGVNWERCSTTVGPTDFWLCFTTDFDVYVRDLEVGKTKMVSVSSQGEPGNRTALFLHPPSISADGRFVAFQSEADNLVQGDSNNWGDVFVRDRLAGRTERVSVSSAGREGTAPSARCRIWLGQSGPCSPDLRASMSADGRFVAFDSQFPNLVEDDLNGFGWDIFVRDRLAGTTELISRGPGSRAPAISADGRFVAYMVFLPDDHRGTVMVHDRITGRDEKVSVSSSGQPPNRPTGWAFPSISADGRYVAFFSAASNLVPGDTNEIGDFFVRDRVGRTTVRVSVSSRGEQQEGNSERFIESVLVSISPDGRFVTFASEAPNLVPRDTNGKEDVFLHDLIRGTTTRVSISSTGDEADDTSYAPFTPGGGRVVFTSAAMNFTPDAESYCQGCNLVYLHRFPIF